MPLSEHQIPVQAIPEYTSNMALPAVARSVIEIPISDALAADAPKE